MMITNKKESILVFYDLGWVENDDNDYSIALLNFTRYIMFLILCYLTESNVIVFYKRILYSIIDNRIDYVDDSDYIHDEDLGLYGIKQMVESLIPYMSGVVYPLQDEIISHNSNGCPSPHLYDIHFEDLVSYIREVIKAHKPNDKLSIESLRMIVSLIDMYRIDASYKQICKRFNINIKFPIIDRE